VARLEKEDCMKNRQIVLAIAAAVALAFAATALAQTRAPSAQGVPGGAGSPTPGTVNPEATDPSTATPSTVSPPAAGQRSTVDPTERRRDAAGNTRMAAAGNVSAGMPVQSTAGEPLGAVRDVAPRASGLPGYVVITLPKGGKTAVPYTTAVSTMRNGTIVLDRARLEGAPRVQDRQLQNHSDQSWQKQADRYWSRRGAAPEPGQHESSPSDQG
jgi:hypothetical protein